jgi:hypothetical protein
MSGVTRDRGDSWVESRGSGLFCGENRSTLGERALEHSLLGQAQELSRRIWIVGEALASQRAEGMAQAPKVSASCYRKFCKAPKSWSKRRSKLPFVINWWMAWATWRKKYKFLAAEGWEE